MYNLFFKPQKANIGEKITFFGRQTNGIKQQINVIKMQYKHYCGQEQGKKKVIRNNIDNYLQYTHFNTIEKAMSLLTFYSIK